MTAATRPGRSPGRTSRAKRTPARIDTVVVNAELWTGDTAGTWANALAIADGRLVAVGSSDDLADLTETAGEVVDAAGAMIVPGFIDAHVHPVKAGESIVSCDLAGAAGRAEYLQRIRAYAASLPAGGWIRGGGWSFDAFPGGVPSAADLDDAVGDRPVALYNRDGHTLWASSAALAAAGITQSTPDPADGRIERLPDGRTPGGALQEGAMRLLEQAMPALTDAEVREALVAGQRYLHSHGITGWQDAKVHPDIARAYASLADDGALTGTVVGAQWWYHERDVTQLEEVLARREELSRSRFRLDAVKIMLDGVCENFTAAVLDPYVNTPHHEHTTGIEMFDTDALVEAVTAIDAAGLQVHFHAVGDAAARQGLNAIAAVRRTNGDLGPRHHMAHLQIVHPDDIPRFRQLGLAATIQPLWARNEPQMTELTLPFLTERRAAWQYPFGSLHRAGTVLAIGSDWPVSTPDPLRQLHVAVNRTPAGDSPTWTPADGVFIPDERLDLAAALRAFTAGSAWVNGVDATHGTLEVGKQADFVVLRHNLFAIDRSAIWDAGISQTWIAGRPVHTND